MLHPDHPQRLAGRRRPVTDDAIARVAAQNVHREAPAGPRWGLALLVTCAILVAATGILWLADARDELREVRIEVQRCRAR